MHDDAPGLSLGFQEIAKVHVHSRGTWGLSMLCSGASLSAWLAQTLELSSQCLEVQEANERRLELQLAAEVVIAAEHPCTMCVSASPARWPVIARAQDIRKGCGERQSQI